MDALLHRKCTRDLRATVQLLTLRFVMCCSAQQKLIVLCARQYMASREAAGRSAKGVVAHVRRTFGIGHSRVRAALDAYDPDGAGLDAPHKELEAVERKSVRHSSGKIVLADAVLAAARQHVHDRLTAGSTTTWGELADYLRTSHRVDITDSACRRRLIEAGFAVLKTRKKPPIDFAAPFWQAQRERFALQYARALHEQGDGQTVIVAMDESFIHLHHHRRISVADTTNPAHINIERKAKPTALLGVGADRGQLQVIVHAVTVDGLLHERHGQSVSVGGGTGVHRRGKSCASAEVVYACGKGSAADDKHSYHGHWTAELFMRWVLTQLLPTFDKLYPKQRMCLLLDNSGNHTRRAANYVSPSAPKSELARVLFGAGVRSFTVDRGVVHVPASRAVPARRGKPGPSRPAVAAHTRADIRVFDHTEWENDAPAGPSAKELGDQVRELYERQPELLLSEVEKLFRDGVRRITLQPYARVHLTHTHSFCVDSWLLVPTLNTLQR